MYVAQFENKNSPGDVRQPLKQNRYCYFPLSLYMMWILCDLLVLPGILFVSLEHASKSSFICFWTKKTNQSLHEGAQVKYHVLDRDIQTDKLDRVMVVPSATLSQLDNVVYYRVPPFPFFFLPRVPRGHPLTLRV